MGDQTAEALINRLKLTDEERMAVWDTLGVLRYQWGMEVFALLAQVVPVFNYNTVFPCVKAFEVFMKFNLQNFSPPWGGLCGLTDSRRRR